MSIQAPCLVATYVDEENKVIYPNQTLYTAAKYPDPKISLAITEYLLSLNADPNARYSKYGDTPLQWAAEEAHSEVVAALLEAGADAKATDNCGTTALHYARDPKSAKLLLDHDANPNARDHTSTPFESAKSRGFSHIESDPGFDNYKVAELLASAGAKVKFDQKDLCRCSSLAARQLLVLAAQRTSSMAPCRKTLGLTPAQLRIALRTYTGPQTAF